MPAERTRIFRYTVDKQTQRMVRFAVNDKDRVKLREHDAPYYYISKKMWDSMGKPPAIKVTVTPLEITEEAIFGDVEG